MVRAAASSVPVDWEVKAGDKLFEQLMTTKKLVTDKELEAQLKAITDPLVAGIKDNRYPLKFHIIEDPTFNAFAMPGGNVVLHSGLLMAADSPEEIAGVLGHEIAHVTQRHSIRSIISFAGLFLLVQTMLGDVTGIVAGIAFATLGALILPARRRKAKRELEEKLAALRQKLVSSLTEQFTREMSRGAQRIEDTIAPFARFVRAENDKISAQRDELVELEAHISGLQAQLRLKEIAEASGR